MSPSCMEQQKYGLDLNARLVFEKSQRRGDSYSSEHKRWAGTFSSTILYLILLTKIAQYYGLRILKWIATLSRFKVVLLHTQLFNMNNSKTTEFQ